ncbi:hypothetical protein ASPZODRAFT_20603 [Penicilliopsis zonata CBS 506.65]|uniref:Zn(2)-C6 fungal-type domain-containing protein n=1 Tax=Penicilliopsis zonata CBS 506.65 TaxID=1073090 RepID=A0A1L9S540_9EURO|nr:hypothetical protein ASPZODRAFT_20603 [Penicilliopsis zonata CBS 506.65]OJJ42276.1 hypothetical protein ASPZODRAFT_20603 [Penicilliopsis zonata CBS 506.65]
MDGRRRWTPEQGIKRLLRSSIHGPRSRRACDSCRVRKCDLMSPCSSCVAAQLDCTFTAPVRKRGPRPRHCVPLNDTPASPTALAPSPDSLSNYSQNESAVEDVVMGSPREETGMVTITTELQHQLGVEVDGLQRILLHCSAVFLDKLYPLEPLVHPTALPQTCREMYQRLRDPRQAHHHRHLVELAQIAALCAKTLIVLPREVTESEPHWAAAFYQASRQALARLGDRDLEHPTVDSIVARYYQSGYLHHQGKASTSWIVLGEAIRMADVLDLHREPATLEPDPWARELRRRVFWILFTADRSASCLMRRPASFRVDASDEINTLFPDEEAFDHPGTGVSPLVGFNLNTRLWRTADQLLREIRSLHLQRRETSLDEAHIRALYLSFETCLDSAPRALHPPAIFETVPLPPRLAIQCANLHISFQCLRIKCLYALEALYRDHACPTWSHAAVCLKKIELAREMLQIIRWVSIDSLKVNGESCVEKLRIAGAALLEVINHDEDAALISRARTQLDTFIHILAELNSKAVDELAGEAG